MVALAKQGTGLSHGDAVSLAGNKEKERAGWIRVASLRVQKSGSAYWANLEGPAAQDKSGCETGFRREGKVQALAAALDYCDARRIRIESVHFG